MLILALASSDLSDALFRGTLLLLLGFAAGRLVTRALARRAAARKARRALARLREVAGSVAEGVGEHASRVLEFSSELDAARSAGDLSLGEIICSSLTVIVRANEQLQEELRKAEAQLKQQAEEIETQAAVARTDALTGLCNRRGFDDELNRRYAERLRHNSVFSLLMMDVDDFKRINDVYGHPSGDEVLCTVAALLTGTFREMDLVARYGGEEFAIILPATHLRDATVAAERIRRAVIEPRYWVKGGEKLRLTVSFGVAQVAQRVGPAQLVARADAALYAAKSSGRNRTFVHDGQSCSSADDVLLSHPSSGNPIALPAPSQPAGAAGQRLGGSS